MTANDWEDAFDCLRSEQRRALLLTLNERASQPVVLGEDAGESHDRTLELGDVDADLDAVRMHHVHLPKLEEAGYIERREDDRVAPGDDFDDIKPLLDTLDANRDALPGIVG